MSQIIKIDDTNVFIGNKDNSVSIVPRESIDFNPQVGLDVDVYHAGMETIVRPKATQSENTKSNDFDKARERVHIDFSNNSNQQIPNIFAVNMLNGRPVNKLIYLVLAFCLGSLGAHKFYAGKIGTGILYFLFCWTGISAILALIDFVLGILTPENQDGNILI